MQLNPRKILYPFHNQIPMKWLIKKTNRKILLPFYHIISETRFPHISNLYSIRRTKQFIVDIEFLCKYFQPISIDQLFEIVSNEKQLNKSIFHLTFDDGLKQFYTIVTPILEKRRIPATIFVNTNFIDNKDICFKSKVSIIIDHINSLDDNRYLYKIFDIFETSFNDIQQLKQRLLGLTYEEQSLINKIAEILNINFYDYLEKFQPYLTSKDIFNLLSKGFTVGSHSLDHPFFNDLSINEQKNQITKSFQFLNNKYNISKKYFSFPFSDNGISAELLNWLYDEENCDLSFGTGGLKDDVYKFHLHRKRMDNNDIPADKIIKSEYSIHLLKMILNKNKITQR